MRCTVAATPASRLRPCSAGLASHCSVNPAASASESTRVPDASVVTAGRSTYCPEPSAASRKAPAAMRRGGARPESTVASSRSNLSEELPALKTSSCMKLGPPGCRKEPACAQHDQRRSRGYGEGPQAQARQFGDGEGQAHTGHADRQRVLCDASG